MKNFDLWLCNHNALRIQAIRRDVIRIRCNATGVFLPSLAERYDLIETEFDDASLRIEESKQTVSVFSGDLVLTLSTIDGSMSLGNANGEPIIRKILPIAMQDGAGTGGTFTIGEKERFYGGGYRADPTLEYRGRILKNRCINVTNYGPSPYLLSSGGWGVLWNNSFENYFDIGSRESDQLVLWSKDGEFDVFIFTGDLRHIVERYTDITGKPMLLPLFGYGLTNICSECLNQSTLLDIAERFRAEGIPCDTLSLEPDWMAQRYDFSTHNDWDINKYHVSDWMPPKRTFLYALQTKGFKLCLWTPCDYDLTYEAERNADLKHPPECNPPRYQVFNRVELHEGAIRDDNMEGKRIADRITVPEESWFDHFKRFFDKGVRGLKQDGSNIIVPHPDRHYANDRGDREMHNLNQSLIAKQYYDGYRAYADKRPMIFTPSTFIGNQKWTATWAGDVGGKQISLTGMLNYSMQGHMNFASDIDVDSLEDFHFGFFMGWAQHMSWAQMAEPWQLSDELHAGFSFYARLRYALLPYIYSAAWQGHRTGLAICRAMVLMYPDDPRAYNLINQYMFGDSLLVGALTDRVYLPKGTWIDYWTGKEYDGMQDITSGYPANRGGYLFIKKGAIIPYWPAVNYVGEKVLEELTLRVYPEGHSEFSLYEDDGESFGYEQGQFALTYITCDAHGKNIVLNVAPRAGSYEGMPKKRRYYIEVYCPSPLSVSAADWQYDPVKGAVCFHADEAMNGIQVQIDTTGSGV
ncbi:MAG: glycoside hydrolase family 31 protein [Clostridiaceae bacterium]|nr:glycoside hydrolase family 31 protein [Clostridiaceae bacterium]